MPTQTQGIEVNQMPPNYTANQNNKDAKSMLLTKNVDTNATDMVKSTTLRTAYHTKKKMLNLGI